MKDVDITIDPEIVLDALDNDDIIEYLGIPNVLAEISAVEVVEYYGHDTLLAEIEEDSAIRYFEIEVAE